MNRRGFLSAVIGAAGAYAFPDPAYVAKHPDHVSEQQALLNEIQPNWWMHYSFWQTAKFGPDSPVPESFTMFGQAFDRECDYLINRVGLYFSDQSPLADLERFFEMPKDDGDGRVVRTVALRQGDLLIAAVPLYTLGLSGFFAKGFYSPPSIPLPLGILAKAGEVVTAQISGAAFTPTELEMGIILQGAFHKPEVR